MNANPFSGLLSPTAAEREAKRARAKLRGEHGNKRKVEARHAPVSNPWRLTPTQCAALTGFAAGKSVGEIAELMEISRKTLSCHLSRASESMRAKNNMHAILMWDRYVRQGGPAALNALTDGAKE